MNYVDFVNQRIKAVTASKRLVVYGQNVSTGSCLSGLSRGFDKIPGHTVINTTNSEATLVGIGFGLMLRGVSSIFFMKQQDFLLLGIEQLSDTWNALRNRPVDASFTIAAIIVDSGWEGPQSCLNNLADITSVSRVPGFTVSNRADAEAVIDRHVHAPGVRIIGVSQRLLRTPLIEYGEPVTFGPDAGVVRYAEGGEATIVAYNLAFPQAMTLHQEFAKRGRKASLFSVSATMPESVDVILANVARTRRLAVVDDSKSVNSPACVLIAAAHARAPGLAAIEIGRHWTPDSSAPNADTLEIDVERVIDALGVTA
ncbi:MAG TPA: hypothetical protein VNF99_20625 [Stellaceae bacterium]|nr:hypothetical protein [Stellaceae bacterium]